MRRRADLFRRAADLALDNERHLNRKLSRQPEPRSRYAAKLRRQISEAARLRARFLATADDCDRAADSITQPGG